MKNVKLIGLIVIFTIGYLTHEPIERQFSPLALENIDALANNEHARSLFCYGTGSIACPDGSYVKYLIEF